MKSIRFASLLTFAVLAGFFIISCGSSEDKLIGSWHTESVIADIDSTKANLTVIDQTIATTKSTRFVLNEDHSMALSIDGYTTKAFWAYNSENDRLSFRLEADALDDAIELGKLDGSKIVYTSSVKHGIITAVYVKD